MAQTYSADIPLGTVAPGFRLRDTISEVVIDFNDIASPVATVVMFICNHCPFVLHINQQLVALAQEFIARNISFVAISSNDAKKYPQDGPDKMTEVAKELDYPFPYLFDENQEVAKAFKAACTPDFFIYDKHLKLVYHGQFDGARPSNNIPVTGIDMREALQAILLGKQVPPKQLPSIGCNIKWKA